MGYKTRNGGYSDEIIYINEYISYRDMVVDFGD